MKKNSEKARKVVTCSNACYFECGHIVHVKDEQIIKIEGNKDNPLGHGYICNRCRNFTQLVYHPDRITYPMKNVGIKGVQNKWVRVSWDEALNLVVEGLQRVKEKYGPYALVAAIDGRPQTWQAALFIRSLGSPNIWGCTDICEGPAMVADIVTTGTLITELTEPDFEDAKYLLVWGANTIVTHSPYWIQMTKARKRNNAKIVVIDIHRSETAEKADQYIQIKPSTDAALSMALMHVIIKEDLYDREFVEKWCYGFDKLEERIQDWAPERAANITGIDKATIIQLAREYANHSPGALLYDRTGVTQRYGSTQAARANTCLVAITGNIDVPGGNTIMQHYPGLHTRSELYLNPQWRLTPEIETNAIGAKRFPLMWQCVHVCHSQSVVKAILDEDPYPVKGVFLMGSNLVISTPENRLTWEALKKLDFMSACDFFLTPTAECADVFLPAATWPERNDVGGEYNQKCMCVRQAAIEPVGEAREDAEIVIELAKLMKKKGYITDDDSFIKWSSLEEFNDWRLKDTGMTFEELKEAGIKRYEHQYKSYEKNGFKTPTGKVELYSTLYENYQYDPLPNYVEFPEGEHTTPELYEKYPLVMTVAKVKPYWHSDGRQIPWARETIPNPEILIHPEDAEKRKIQNGDWVWVENTKARRIKLKVSVTDKMQKGVLIGRHAWWFPEKPDPDHGAFESNMNVLTNHEPCDPVSGAPSFRGFLVEIYKMD